jgi:hypothetical protein
VGFRLVQTKQSTQFWFTLTVTVLIMIIMLLHTNVYGGRNYREDEINSVHASFIKTPSEIVTWMATDVHPPGWRLFAELWVESFGGVEEVTRWSSKLLALLTYALVFQLGKQVVDIRTGIFAVVILGIYGFASNGMNELRPYPMLITITTALHVLFYRWLHCPTRGLMIAYVALGIAAIYTHFFAFFIFPAHAIYLVIFRRFDRKIWIQSFLMWFFVTLSFSAWVLPFLYVILIPFPGGIYYAIPDGLIGLEILYKRVNFEPELIQQFLVLLSLFTPLLLTQTIHRQRLIPQIRLQKHWNLLYPLGLLISTLLIAVVVNSIVSSLTARNLLMNVMLLALLMALGLRLLPLPASLILLLLLVLGAPQEIKTSTSNAPYREIVQLMSERYETDSLVLTEFSAAWRWLMPASYYLMDFTPDNMSKQRMFHIIDSDDFVHPPAFPDELVNIYDSFTGDFLNADLPEHSQLWVLQEGNDNSHQEDIQTWLNQNYALVQKSSWIEDFPTPYTLSEYVHAPDSLQLMLNADEKLELYSWELKDSVDVSPCQSVEVESWWQTNSLIDTPYRLSLILADNSGQVAIHEGVPANVFTIEWEVEKNYRDISQLTIPCDITQGNYNLLLGMKETLTGEPLSLTYPDGNSIGTLYYLTTLNTQGS